MILSPSLNTFPFFETLSAIATVYERGKKKYVDFFGMSDELSTYTSIMCSLSLNLFLKKCHTCTLGTYIFEIRFGVLFFVFLLIFHLHYCTSYASVAAARDQRRRSAFVRAKNIRAFSDNLAPDRSEYCR